MTPDETVARRGPQLSTDDLSFFFASHHAALASLAREAAAEMEVLEREHGTTHEAARSAIAALGARGLFQYFAPSGGTIDLRALCLIREALAWSSGAADSLFAVQGLGCYPIHAYGTDEQKRRWLAPALEGRSIAAFGLTEPEAGTDVASLRTTAVSEGDHWRLDGDKVFISNAPIADHIVIFANANPTAGRKGITAFLVPRGTPGLTISGQIPMVADHSIGALSLRGCLVPDDHRLGAVGQGFAIAMSTLDNFRVTVGAAAVGMARRALQEATRRAVVRHQFSKPIAEQQQIQGYLADMCAELDAARLLVLRAALLRDQGSNITQEAAIAKMYATEAAQRIIDRALQIHGGLGVVRGIAVERLYREIRALRIYEGTTEIQRVVIATRMIQAERARSTPSERRP
ncbi:MAG: acyl-CoA dehydrogenase family protein [Myxococcales bacterium]|nr:acyl-CoA dehydrogenase family protein [Polyangiaceae bacterium]MDW8247920.1 acyl-CoA dehydrogenase family protein [Myxococcales bacterium]